VLVHGPYLVRHVASENDSLALHGDILKTTHIEVFASQKFQSLSWNGRKLQASRTKYGSLKASIAACNRTIDLPRLENWKVHDGLPEKLPSYNDSSEAWVEANHMSTLNPTKPETLPVLYVDEYGFHNSFHLFRGYFEGAATGVDLALQGGLAFGWTAWLNGQFIGSHFGNNTVGTGNMSLSFSDAALVLSGTNVLL
jgi:hypothetical protein